MTASDPPPTKPGDDAELDRLLAAAFARPSPSAEAVAPAPDRPLDEPTDVSDRYVVLGELGRGGVGVVLRGRDRELERDVAIKVLRPEHAAHEALSARFVAEARIGGHLEHPGTVPVYEMGRTKDARPYFTMKLVQGRTLASLLAARADPADERARFVAIFEQVCHAVAYAHSRGVIHRDLKPANVMVGAFGEVQVADWGLAKVVGVGTEEAPPAAAVGGAPRSAGDTATPRLSSSQFHSQAGSVLGTLAYMPPEQARGEVERVDARADVFSLGALLCEILTGAPPYVGDITTVFEHARVGRLDDALARLDRCGADAELVALARACLAADPAARPRDARDVATSVSAHRAALGERARAAEIAAAAATAKAGEERRARRLTTALALTIVAALLIFGAAWLKSERDQRLRQETAARPVRDALARARTLAQDAAAMAAPANLERWHDAAAAARQASDAAHSGDPGEAITQEADAEAARLTAAAAERDRDQAMAIEIGRIFGSWNTAPWPVVDAHFERAYRDWGVDFSTMDDAAIVARIRASERAIEIAQGIFGWIRTRAALPDAHGEPRDFRRFLAVCDGVDPDPWRTKIRMSLLDRDMRRSILAIADGPAARDFDLTTTLFLGFMLVQVEEYGRALDLFRAMWLKAPADYVLSIEIGEWSTSVDPPRWSDALAYATAAASIEPEIPAPFVVMGRAHDALCDWPAAAAKFRHALEMAPEHGLARTWLALALFRGGDDEGAAQEFARVAAMADRPPAGELALVDDALRRGDAAAAHARLVAALDHLGSGEVNLDGEERSRDWGDLALRLAESGDAAGALERTEAVIRRFNLLSRPWTQYRLQVTRAELLLGSGRLDEAVAAFDRAAALAADERLVRGRAEAAGLAGAARHFEALSSGEWEPASAAEFVASARYAQQQQSSALAFDLWRRAFEGDLQGARAADPSARVDAVHAALSVAAGEGADVQGLTEGARRHASATARVWLADEMRARTQPEAPRGALRTALERWLRDPALFVTRDRTRASAAFGADEARAWAATFAEIRERLKTAPAR
ncbi:MAG TPA: protein kinase [Planctomycetota bacterium]|nr:protein kinase [Planctomycetota bacterium]